MSGLALRVADDHPAYAGHFPDAPILPAVVLLAEAIAAIEAATGVPAPRWTLAQAKFPRAVTPGTPLTLTHEGTAGGGVRFEIRSADGTVASGSLVPAIASA